EVTQNNDGALLDVFVRPVLTIEGYGSFPYGMWVPTFPKRVFGSATWTGTVSLLSLESVLTDTSAASVVNTTSDVTVQIPQGTVVTEWITNALALAGFTQVAIQASAKVESAPQTYTNGETLLQVINAELE